MFASDIVEKSWPLLTDELKQDWHEMPTDIDNMVAHDWIRDVIKPALISGYKQLGSPEFARFQQTEEMRAAAIATLGMIEIYFSEFQKG